MTNDTFLNFWKSSCSFIGGRGGGGGVWTTRESSYSHDCRRLYIKVQKYMYNSSDNCLLRVHSMIMITSCCTNKIMQTKCNKMASGALRGWVTVVIDLARNPCSHCYVQWKIQMCFWWRCRLTYGDLEILKREGRCNFPWLIFSITFQIPLRKKVE